MPTDDQTTAQSLDKTKTHREMGELRLMELMMENEFQLLNIICHGSLSGDHAAVASKGILKILNQKDKKVTVAFIQKVFSERIKYYRFKSKDIADITRDNGLVTMLLVAYEQWEGQDYLKELLSKTLNELVTKLAECEMDSVKIRQQKPELSDEELDEQLTQNRLRLEYSCQKLFDHVFDSYDMVPRSIRRMCTFLTRTIEQSDENVQVDSAAAQFKSGMSKTISQQRHANMIGKYGTGSNNSISGLQKIFGKGSTGSIDGVGSISSGKGRKPRPGTKLREEIKIQEEGDSLPHSPSTTSSPSESKLFKRVSSMLGSKNKGLSGSGSGILKSEPEKGSGNLKGVGVKSPVLSRSISSQVVKEEEELVKGSVSDNNLRKKGEEKNKQVHERKAAHYTPIIEGQLNETIPTNAETVMLDPSPTKDSHETALIEKNNESGISFALPKAGNDTDNSLNDIFRGKSATSSHSSRDTILKPWVKKSMTVKRKNENSFSQSPFRPLSMDFGSQKLFADGSLRFVIPSEGNQNADFETHQVGMKQEWNDIERENTINSPKSIIDVNSAPNLSKPAETKTDPKGPISSISNEPSLVNENQSLNVTEPIMDKSNHIPKSLERELTIGKTTTDKSNVAIAKSNVPLLGTVAAEEVAVRQPSKDDEATSVHRNQENEPPKGSSVGDSAKRPSEGEGSLEASSAAQAAARKSMTLNNLSVSEKVVGSFLFLRFIVPAIATPERYGIVLEKLDPGIRRGLVLCSKMMTALCNDKEFGSKDSLLIPCNNFLKPYRYPMKQFIVDCTRRTIPSVENLAITAQSASVPKVVIIEEKSLTKSEESADKIDKEGSFSVFLKNAISKKSKSSHVSSRNSLNKETSMTQSHNSQNSATNQILKTVSPEAPPGITNDSDVIGLLYTLQKSMKKLELDVEVRAQYLGEENKLDIEVRFKEFKELLLAHYSSDNRQMAGESTKKSQELPKEVGIMTKTLNVLRRWLRRRRSPTI